LIAELKVEEQTRPAAAGMSAWTPYRVRTAVAEVGADMKPFPSAQHLASWAGMCPGNEESAGKRQRGHITRAIAGPSAPWSRQRREGVTPRRPIGRPQHRRLVGRRVKKRALVAVGHSMLTIFYHTLKGGHDLC
jgi:transposase